MNDPVDRRINCSITISFFVACGLLGVITGCGDDRLNPKPKKTPTTCYVLEVQSYDRGLQYAILSLPDHSRQHIQNSGSEPNWNGLLIVTGDYVSLLDGKIIAIEKHGKYPGAYKPDAEKPDVKPSELSPEEWLKAQEKEKSK